MPFAVAGLEQRGQKADRGALAGAVGPDEAEQLAGLDLQVQRLDGREVAVVLAEIDELDHVCGRLPRMSARAACRCINCQGVFLLGGFRKSLPSLMVGEPFGRPRARGLKSISSGRGLPYDRCAMIAATSRPIDSRPE